MTPLLRRLGRAPIRRVAQGKQVDGVAVASHTPALAAATPRFAAALADVALRSPAPNPEVLSGPDGNRVRDPALARATLTATLSSPLRWHLCLESCRERRVGHVLEFGPGQALATVAQAALAEPQVRSLDGFRTLDAPRGVVAVAA